MFSASLGSLYKMHEELKHDGVGRDLVSFRFSIRVPESESVEDQVDSG